MHESSWNWLKKGAPSITGTSFGKRIFFFHNTYLEQEAHRRRADGKTKRLAVALDRSQKGIEFWQNYIDNGFDKLMENAKLVQSGERSSFVRHKEAKKENQSRNTKKNRSKNLIRQVKKNE